VKRSAKTLAVFALLAVFAGFAWWSLPRPQPQSAGYAGASSEPAHGVVLAVNRTAATLTISHGPLQALGMGPMTMEFQVDDVASLERLNAGDRVRFHVEAAGGTLRAMRIEVAK
jgi:Cu/Ag efflux protein CusF